MRSIRLHLFMMALATTALTALSVTTILYIIDVVPGRTAYRQVVYQVMVAWQQDSKQAGPGWGDNPQGYVITPTGHIAYSFGEKACKVAELITQCLADVAAIPPEGRLNRRDSGAWYEYQVPLRDGLRIVARVQPYTIWGYFRDFYQNTLRVYLIALASALPITILLVWITVRPFAQRLHRIAEASRLFAHGQFTARTQEKALDEIGQLGQRFDQMASTIGQQMQELRRLAEQNSTLTLALEQNARTAERANLSRDLHDAVSQHLFSLAMGTANLATMIRQAPAQAIPQAEQLAAIAAQAQDELRSVLQRLRPSGRSEQGLVESLKKLGEEWQKCYGISLALQLQLATVPLPALLEDILYRVCQEGLNNVARHAAAKQASLLLTQSNAAVMLTITDNGCGFDSQTTSSGLGLLGMTERIRAVGGELAVDSVIGQGTQVRVILPFQHALA